MSDNNLSHDNIVTIEVSENIEGNRLDKFLADHQDLELTRSKIQKLIKDGKILVDDSPAAAKYQVTTGQIIKIEIPPKPPSEIIGENISLDIRYSDEYLIVVNKPAGMVTHPAVGNRSGTLVNALVHHFKTLATEAGEDRPGIVHRLDKETSGLLVVARDDDVYLKLQKAIQDRSLTRTYLALICGHMKETEGQIDLPIGRSTQDHKKMVVSELNGKTAQTKYELSERFRLYDLLKLTLLTGRTHQIRVHLSYLSHPVFADATYGGKEKHYRTIFGPDRPLVKKMNEVIKRQALHAALLQFEHPVTKEMIKIEAELPDDFQAVLDLLRSENQQSE